MRSRVIALLVLLPCLALPALAADSPQEVYAKFHRAAVMGELEEMLKLSPAKRRAEGKTMSAGSKAAAIKMAQHLLPRGYQLLRTTVQVDGRAILLVSGPWFGEGEKPLTMYGVVRLLLEDGEWKFDESHWSTQKPMELAGPRPAPPPNPAAPPPNPAAAAMQKPGARPADKAPAKAAAPTKAAPSAYTEVPTRKLGEAKQGCVYKPVMTAQDMEACK